MGVALTSFAVFAAAQVGTPGPANLLLMTAGARHGLRRALPFVGGVALGKQAVIWPVGLGLLSLADRAPALFVAMKWAAAAYVFWLAWRIAGSRLAPVPQAGPPPGFAAGLAVHPLNPKAWAMVTAAFASFVEPGTPVLAATATIGAGFLAVQALMHPLWAWGGAGLAHRVAGTPAEPALMVVLAALTLLSVGWVLFAGGET